MEGAFTVIVTVSVSVALCVSVVSTWKTSVRALSPTFRDGAVNVGCAADVLLRVTAVPEDCVHAYEAMLSPGSVSAEALASSVTLAAAATD